jgi:hypothetical protein
MVQQSINFPSSHRSIPQPQFMLISLAGVDPVFSFISELQGCKARTNGPEVNHLVSNCLFMVIRMMKYVSSALEPVQKTDFDKFNALRSDYGCYKRNLLAILIFFRQALLPFSITCILY